MFPFPTLDASRINKSESEGGGHAAGIAGVRKWAPGDLFAARNDLTVAGKPNLSSTVPFLSVTVLSTGGRPWINWKNVAYSTSSTSVSSP